MIHESVVDRCLNRLSAHFGPRLVIRPPATAAEVAELEALVGPLPRDLRILLATCDGLRVPIDDPAMDRHFWHVRETRETIAGEELPNMPPGMFPIHGNLPGACDWLVLAEGPIHGVVVRWDPWTGGAVVVASSIGHYLDAWTHYLVTHFDEDGDPHTQERPEFDALYVRERDPGATALAAQPEVATWLTRLDRAVASGEDFE